MAVNIPGIVSVAVFYIAILLTGIIVGKKTSKNKSGEAVLIADRSFNLFVSICTLTATNIGGGYILGTAESTAFYGLLQTVAPFGYFVAFFIAGFLYVPKIRDEGYITMFDPFQLKYGKKVGAMLFIPQLMGDLFWGAAVLGALGATLSIILDMSSTISIIISAAVAVVYTFFGGLYSVAYTDVIQLLFIVVGLLITFPFCMTHPAVDFSTISDTWLGEIPQKTIASYIDIVVLCTFGGIPWQVFYQRVLACRTTRTAQISTFIAAIFTLLLAVPPMAMGLTGAATDWNATDYSGPIPIPAHMRSYILPLTLHFLSPLPVAIIGIGAISAAVMSSCDSAVLSSSSVITKNIYHVIIRPQASERELMWVLRVNIIITGALSALVAIFSTTIYGLFVLCADLMCVVLFPQLTLVLWMPQSNAYGCVAGFFVSLILRVLSGEPVIKLPAVIKFPYYDEEYQMQLFPHRTLAMLLGTLVIIVVSIATNALFLKGRISQKYDVFKCHRQRSIRIKLNDDYLNDAQTDQDKEESIALKLKYARETKPF